MSNEIFCDTDTLNWNKLMDSYEQYVDKYISFEKNAKDDMEALAEYPLLMQKAQEFSERMEGAKGSMSESQWARYSQIYTKMLEVAQYVNYRCHLNLCNL